VNSLLLAPRLNARRRSLRFFAKQKSVHAACGRLKLRAASGKQTAGIEQINQAITQMDQVTQQNAALVEEAAGASEALQGHAAELAEVVSVFKLDGLQPRGNAGAVVMR
jgi:uncharacterized phage infection (PIP) family protein YhgE